MQRRSAFTITELLVSMALIMFIMAILSEAYIAGITAFSDLKAVGDMDQRLRAALVIMRRDLTDGHVDPSASGPVTTRVGNLTAPPAQGFFVVGQAGGGSFAEGQDPELNWSYRAPNPSTGAGLHSLYFSVNRGYNQSNNTSLIRYSRIENYFLATVPSGSVLESKNPFFGNDPGLYRSQFAEVAYFVQANGFNAPSGAPLYSLYRRQALIPTNTDAAAAAGTWNAAGYYDISGVPGTANCNTMATVTSASSRYLSNGTAGPWAATPFSPYATPSLLGSDLLLTDVLSFDVQLIMSGATDFSDVTYYDTATSGTYPLGVQIIIRVWDFKTQQARQITIVQDL